MAGRKGGPLAAPFDVGRQAALREEIGKLAGGRLPPSVKALLAREAADLTAVCERYMSPMDTTGLLTRKGFLRVAYQREYLGRMDRLERLMDLLGFTRPDKGTSAGLTDRVLRRMTPAAREAFERGE
jgi:hypothetical protein